MIFLGSADAAVLLGETRPCLLGLFLIDSGHTTMRDNPFLNVNSAGRREGSDDPRCNDGSDEPVMRPTGFTRVKVISRLGMESACIDAASGVNPLDHQTAENECRENGAT